MQLSTNRFIWKQNRQADLSGNHLNRSWGKKTYVNTSLLAACSVLALILTSCDFGNRPAILTHGTPDQIKAEAIQTAKNDVAAGHTRICIAGTVGTWPVGVPKDKMKIIEGLPEWKMPCGCTEPLAKAGIMFAEAYNTTVLGLLEKH